MKQNELPTLLGIAEKLLSLAEAQAETNLEDMRSRLRYRREMAEQLSNIETAIARLRGETDPALLKRSELVPLLKSVWPYVLSALTALSGWGYHFFHR